MRIQCSEMMTPPQLEGRKLQLITVWKIRLQNALLTNEGRSLFYSSSLVPSIAVTPGNGTGFVSHELLYQYCLISLVRPTWSRGIRGKIWIFQNSKLLNFKSNKIGVIFFHLWNRLEFGGKLSLTFVIDSWLKFNRIILLFIWSILQWS